MLKNFFSKFLIILVPSQKVSLQFLISFLLSMTILLVSVWGYLYLQPELPIFYTLATASNKLAPKYTVFIFPGISMLISVLHLLFLNFFKLSDEIINQLFAWGTVVIQALLFLAFLRIIFIVS